MELPKELKEAIELEDCVEGLVDEDEELEALTILSNKIEGKI